VGAVVPGSAGGDGWCPDDGEFCPSRLDEGGQLWLDFGRARSRDAQEKVGGGNGRLGQREGESPATGGGGAVLEINHFVS
jgi:hypothetical protein